MLKLDLKQVGEGVEVGRKAQPVITANRQSQPMGLCHWETDLFDSPMNSWRAQTLAHHFVEAHGPMAIYIYIALVDREIDWLRLASVQLDTKMRKLDALPRNRPSIPSSSSSKRTSSRWCNNSSLMGSYVKLKVGDRYMHVTPEFKLYVKCIYNHIHTYMADIHTSHVFPCVELPKCRPLSPGNTRTRASMPSPKACANAWCRWTSCCMASRPWGGKPFEKLKIYYPLVNVYIAMENHHVW